MNTRERITELLTKTLAPERVEVIDESHLHAGHAGSRPGGETHYRVRIVADVFRGKSRLDRHRMVNAVLADELAGGVHALAIHASAPGETAP
jgi:BolA protein